MAKFWIDRKTFVAALERMAKSNVHQIMPSFVGLKYLGVNEAKYVEVRSGEHLQKKYWIPFFGVRDRDDGGHWFLKPFEGSLAVSGNYAHGSQFTPLRELRKPFAREALEWQRDELHLPTNDTSNYRLRFKNGYVQAVASAVLAPDKQGNTNRIPLDALAVYMQAMEGSCESKLDLKGLITAWRKRLHLTPEELASWFDSALTLGNPLSKTEFTPHDAAEVIVDRFPPPAAEVNGSTVGSASGSSLPADSRTILVSGPPGCGKSSLVESWTSASAEVVRTVFFADTTHADFVGTVRPVPILIDVNGVSELRSAFNFVPGPFSIALSKAMKGKSSDVVLVIEELNRADAASVFGEVFHLLDRADSGAGRFSITASADLAKFLTGLGLTLEGDNAIRLPKTLSIIATMNTSDESLRPLDSAFRRRWDPVELSATNGAGALRGTMIEGEESLEWVDFVERLNDRILSARPGEDCRIGIWFVKAKKKVISKADVGSKLLPFLWQDIHRHARVPLFRESLVSLRDAQVQFAGEGLSGIFDWMADATADET